MIELKNPNNQPVIQVAGQITVTCQHILGPNGQVMQTACNVAGVGFDMNTADGQLAAFTWLMDAAKSLGVNVSNLHKQGGTQPTILKPPPGLKLQ